MRWQLETVSGCAKSDESQNCAEDVEDERGGEESVTETSCERMNVFEIESSVEDGRLDAGNETQLFNCQEESKAGQLIKTYDDTESIGIEKRGF